MPDKLLYVAVGLAMNAAITEDEGVVAAWITVKYARLKGRKYGARQFIHEPSVTAFRGSVYGCGNALCRQGFSHSFRNGTELTS
jgi:hypothetical protein